VIIGHLIPAGTGIERLRRVRVTQPEDEGAAEGVAEGAEAGGQVAVGGEEVMGGLK